LNELSNPLQIRYRDGGWTPPAYAAHSVCVSLSAFFITVADRRRKNSVGEKTIEHKLPVVLISGFGWWCWPNRV